MPFALIRNDIVKMNTDAIVNAANSSLMPGGGVCGAIFRASGYDQLNQACRKIGHCEVGQAVLTPGYQLPAKYIIHAVGPIWCGGTHNEAELLRSCYIISLKLAQVHGCESIAFPLISSGIYGYPKKEALQIAVTAIRDYLQGHEMMVYLIVFDRCALAAGQERFAELRSYIDNHYVDTHTFRNRGQTDRLAQQQQMEEQAELFQSGLSSPVSTETPNFALRMPTAPEPTKRSLKERLFHLDESFSKMLLRMIDEKGMTDVEVYKRANMDRKLFSKIRKDSYTPSKQTAIALAISLRLNTDETKDLLGRAGYALSPSSKFDVIVQYFIEEGIYDIYEVNQALFAFNQKLLGA